MSDDETPKVKSRWRPRRADSPRLSPEHAKRQSLITHLAFTTLGGREEAMAFLNSSDADLAARPLDLAMESAAGYIAVRDAILMRARPSEGSLQ